MNNEISFPKETKRSENKHKHNQKARKATVHKKPWLQSTEREKPTDLGFIIHGNPE